MPNLNKITNEERNLKIMREKKILLELSDVLLREKLINIEEKIKIDKLIRKVNV